MYKSETQRVVRIGASALIAVALTVGTSAAAFADGSHSHGNSDHHQSNKGHHEDADAVVTALGASSFTAQSGDGAPVVYTTTPATTYFAGSTAVTMAALAIGEKLDIALTNTTSPTVVKVSIDLSSFEGKVTSVAGNIITIAGDQNTPRTITVTSTTTYSVGETASTFAAIVVGSEIDARGLLGSTPGTLSAFSVKIAAPRVHFGGVVTALGTNTFTLQKDSSAPVLYTTTPTTTYFEGSTTVTFGALAIGQDVEVTLTSTVPQTVSSVSIDLASFEGVVTAVSGNVVTIAGHQDSARTVNVTPTTTYSQGGSTTTLSAIVVGSKIEARGLVGPTPSTLTALSVKIAKVHSEGRHGDSNSKHGSGDRSAKGHHSRHGGH